MELRRAPQPQPTEPGLYYARFVSGNEIEVVQLTTYHFSGPRVWIPGDEDHWALTDVEAWFGPVPTCVESGS